MCDQFASYRISEGLQGRFAGVAAALGILATASTLLFAQTDTPMSGQSTAKLPIPPQADQQKLLDALDEIYEIDKKRTDEEKVKLIQDLLEGISETENKPTDRFVLLRKAMELASEAGEAVLMIEVIDRIAADYQIDPMTTKGKMLKAVAEKAKTPERIASLVEASNKYIDQAVALERFDYAEHIATLACRATQRSRAGDLHKQMLKRSREIQKLNAEQKKLEEALAAVQANPNDAQANLVVGRLYCFSRGNWQRGPSYLAKGSDAELAGLAGQELAAPMEAADQIKLGDAWWNLAERKKAREKEILMQRAGFWYRKAQEGSVTGLAKVKIEKRLEELAERQSTAAETRQVTPRLPLALKKALVLNYSFDKNEEAKVTDKSGKNNHGRVAGPKWVANARGPRNGAYVFDGVDDLMLLPNSTLGNGNALTFSVWANVPPYSGSSWPVFIGSYIGSASKNTAIGIAQSTGTLRVEVTTDKGNFANHKGSLPVPWNTWFHAALVYDGATLTEYINGVRGRSIPASGNLKTPTVLTLGRDHTVYDALRGAVDEVMIFNRALTDEEVKLLFKTQRGK